MKRRHVALFALLPFALAACAAAPPTADLAAEEQAIRAISMRWLESERAGDAAAIAALFAQDGTLFRDATEPLVGTAAIQAFLTEDFARNMGHTVDWTVDRVEVAPAGDFAAEYGTWTESGTDATGTTTEDHGRYMTTYRKVNGEWKIVADMSLSTKPEAPANPEGA
jgi:uncharacterized protein (TIGR02246 family)